MRHRPDRHRGGGKYEFLVLLTMIGALAAVLLDRLLEVEREAERTEVGLTVRNMRVGLTLAVGERLMQGREDRLGELLDADPTAFLGQMPRGRGDGGTGPGAWRFDRGTRILAYRPRQPEAFGGRSELCWRISAFGPIHGRIVGIALENLSNCEITR